MTDKKIMLTTVGSQDEARKIAHALVEARLAACVNIIPRIESVYRWEGKVETAEECLLIIKTTSLKLGPAEALVKKLHSYDLPECIVTAIEDGSADYLNWIEESVGDEPK
ncbi:MAG: divalent-cation tolerance protein CutA [Acidobacteriota bacterium]|nr:divalent-cation tolerance protein CutA [Acidobacteriota bacterium]